MGDTIDWKQVKREDMEKDALDDLMYSNRPVICDDCTKRIGKYYDEKYYDIDGIIYCEECISKYKRYT